MHVDYIDYRYRALGKVMFSEACVSHSVHMGGGSLSIGRQTLLKIERPPSELTSRLLAVTAAVGMHPTGMQSC